MPCGEVPVSLAANQGTPPEHLPRKLLAVVSVLQYHETSVAKAASLV